MVTEIWGFEEMEQIKSQLTMVETQLTEARKSLDFMRRMLKDDRIIQIRFHKVLSSLCRFGIEGDEDRARQALRDIKIMVDDVTIGLEGITNDFSL